MSQAQTPIVEYKFNETGTSTVVSTGTDNTALTLRNSSGIADDLHSADGLGVSGQTGDRAFDNTSSSNMGGVGGRADQADLDAIDNLESFTLQGWFKTEGTTSLRTNTMFFNNTSGNGVNKNGFELYGIAEDLKLEVKNNSAKTSHEQYDDTQTWTFFAVTYDGTSPLDNVKFYKGSPCLPVSQVGTDTVDAVIAGQDSNGLTIGNNSDSYNDAFDGFIDNFRIFGTQTGNSGALSQVQLENIRSGDILPTVCSVSPANGATGVAITNTIIATFNEAMDVSSITISTFTVNNGSNNIGGTISYNGVTATFTPSINLSYSTTYIVMITMGAKDLDGNAMTSAYTWSFTTVATPGSEDPHPETLFTINSTNPPNGATDVTVNTLVCATFSMYVNGSTLTTDTVELTGGGNEVAGSVTTSGATAVFTPLTRLAYSTMYTAMITTKAQAANYAGTTLDCNYIWNFMTTGDVEPPTVISTSPVNGATDMGIDSIINATFSEVMDGATINDTTFTISGVSGSVACDGTNAIFTPSSPLAYSTTYTATITSEIKDLAGNAIVSPYHWSFRTISPPTPIPFASPASKGAIFGTVYDSGEGQREGVVVTLTSSSFSDHTKTDEDGYYKFEGLAAGDYVLTYEKEGYNTQTRSASLGEGEVVELGTVTMERIGKGKIFGYVVDTKGNPIESVKLLLRGINTKTSKTTYSNANGFFEFSDLEVDIYKIFAKKRGYRKSRRVVKLKEGKNKAIEIIMKKVEQKG